MTTEYFFHPLDYAQGREGKPYKHTLFEGERLLVGSNSLLPGQSQPMHDHTGQDKFYLVLEGSGFFTVGETQRTCGPGDLILAPSGVPHGVDNRGDTLLTFLTVIAPWS
jgi:quercetin dioxygenase-like cupin family protein